MSRLQHRRSRFPLSLSVLSCSFGSAARSVQASGGSVMPVRFALFGSLLSFRVARPRAAAVLVGVLALVVSLVTPARAAHAASTPKGRVVLDPDDDYSHAVWGGTTYTELPITYAIARAAKAKLENLCDTSVVISRDASLDFVPRAQRAALMTDADVSLTISLNNLTGSPWGTATDGGAQAYATANAHSAAFGQNTLDEWTRFTGRPNAGGVNQGGTNGTQYPYPEFAGLPGTYAQTFFGYVDHNFDWPAISATFDGAQYGHVTDAVVTAVGRQLQAQGIGCGDTSAGQAAFPAAPSAAQLAALFALGFANWMRYGSDPVNFATGNFLQAASLFTGVGSWWNGHECETDLQLPRPQVRPVRAWLVEWSGRADPNVCGLLCPGDRRGRRGVGVHQQRGQQLHRQDGRAHHPVPDRRAHPAALDARLLDASLHRGRAFRRGRVDEPHGPSGPRLDLHLRHGHAHGPGRAEPVAGRPRRQQRRVGHPRLLLHLPRRAHRDHRPGRAEDHVRQRRRRPGHERGPARRREMGSRV